MGISAMVFNSNHNSKCSNNSRVTNKCDHGDVVQGWGKNWGDTRYEGKEKEQRYWECVADGLAVQSSQSSLLPGCGMPGCLNAR